MRYRLPLDEYEVGNGVVVEVIELGRDSGSSDQIAERANGVDASGILSVDHGSGITGYYYSLSKAMNVVEGDRVNAGEVIGAVGDTAECEAAEVSHLHFGLKKNDSWIDPIEYIGIKYSK